MIGIGMPSSQRRIPLPMFAPVVGDGLNERSEFRVPVDQMFAAQLTATAIILRIIYATRVNAGGLTHVNQTRGI